MSAGSREGGCSPALPGVQSIAALSWGFPLQQAMGRARTHPYVSCSTQNVPYP